MKRLLALDHGSVRIGAAISDPLHIFAKPLKVIANRGFKPVLSELQDIIQAQDIGMIILGLPLAIEGGKTQRTLEVESFGEKLKKALDIEIIYWDERYSSAEADEELIKLGYTWQESRNLKDAMAAALILKSYLESLS
ncbi:MAG: Holliday junction resolvase RuvX [Candidatus Cloacimonetes bacterium]|nr:Holliday junction resolvase RuvX [Candidatus Cloacimonadota bacterium]